MTAIGQDLAAGSVIRTQTRKSWDWPWRAWLGFRLPCSVTLRGRIDRTPYLYTKSSLDTPVMVQTAAGLVHWDDQRGWLGEAAYQQEHYPDDNTIRTEYGWLLDRKSTRLNSSHTVISYAVFCLKKKN